MYQTSNFTPLQTKKNSQSKEKKAIFSPKSTTLPLKPVYTKISKTQYIRTIYMGEKEKNK